MSAAAGYRALACAAAIALAACGDAGGGGFEFPIVDAAPPSDGALGVACRGANCALGTVCCRMFFMPGRPPAHFCVPEEQNCDGPTYRCDGPEDCRGDAGVCCSDQDGAVLCTPKVDGCPFRACHTDAECDEGTRCCDTPAGVVKVCQQPGACGQ